MKMTVTYNEDKNLIQVWDEDKAMIMLNIPPEEFLDALDECILMRYKKLELEKIIKMSEYIKKMEQLSEDARKTETKTELYKIKVQKECLAQIRYAVRLVKKEQEVLKAEMLERQLK